eukprot:SAG31_NODE_3093_length_4682_cov_47.973816_1_plen_45_part_10
MEPLAQKRALVTWLRATKGMGRGGGGGGGPKLGVEIWGANALRWC